MSKRLVMPALLAAVGVFALGAGAAVNGGGARWRGAE